jgi:hypothetical protein
MGTFELIKCVRDADSTFMREVAHFDQKPWLLPLYFYLFSVVAGSQSI